VSERLAPVLTVSRSLKIKNEKMEIAGCTGKERADLQSPMAILQFAMIPLQQAHHPPLSSTLWLYSPHHA
jgi:hypothetical protein